MRILKKIIKILIANLFLSFFVPKAIKKIEEVSDNQISPSDAYDWTEKFRVGPSIRGLNINFRSSQIKEEIISLAERIRQEQPQILLEIGTATGGTLFILSQASAPTAKIISIDLPFGRYGAGYLKYRLPLMKRFGGKNRRVELLRLDSHLETTVSKLKEVLGGKQIDFLFIDGDHSYEGVKADFETYSTFVKDGGLIAFHDIVANDLDPSFGTQQFWNEIKGRFPHEEFIKQGRGNTGCGIGLIKYSGYDRNL